MAHGKEIGSPVSSVAKAPKTDEDVLAFVNDTWSFLKNSRLGLEQRIKESRHFLTGDQWIRYLPHNRKFSRHILADYVPTPVTNYLAKAYDRLLDLFISGQMLPVVDPATDDQEDVDAARAATRALQSEFARLKTLTDCYTPAAGWMILCGNAFISARWNGKAGRKIQMPRTQLIQEPVTQDIIQCEECGQTYPPELAPQQCTSCGSPDLSQQQVHGLDPFGGPSFAAKEEAELDEDGKQIVDSFKAGDLEEKCLNVLNFYPQPADSFDRSRHCIEIDVMNVDEVKSLFGSKAKEVVSEHLEIEDYGVNHNEAWSSFGFAEQIREQDKVLVKFFRAVPDKRWAKGLFLIVANDRVLHKGNLDSADGKLPYTHLKWRDVPGAFWGAGPFEDMIPQQKRLNAIDSHIVQNRKQMVSNQWLVPKGASISHIDGRPGLMIRYDPAGAGGYKPERQQGVPVPSQVLQERSQAIQDLYEVGGPTEELSGRLPSGPETGPAVELVQEAAVKRFGPIVLAFRTKIATHEERKLRLIGKYWKETRLIKVLGENKEIQAYHLNRASLRRGTDMTVRINETLDFSPALKRQRVMDAAKQGLLGDVSQPQIRGKILEKLGIEGFESEYILDAKKARRVLSKLRDGEQPTPPTQFENHGVQFQILKEFMLTTDFENLDTDLQRSIMQRAGVHQQFMQQEQQRVMQAAQAAKGTGDQVSGAVADSGALGGAPQTQTQGAQ